jgi:Mg-chelatase subunit ChlD
MKYNLIKYLPLFFLNFIFGQDELTQKIINQYVEYINHCNFYVSSSHFSIKSLNIDIARRFRKPKEYKLNKQLFKKDCFTENYNICNDKLDTLKINEEYLNLLKSINQLKGTERIELLFSIKTYQTLFNETKKSVQLFSNLKTDESFYFNELKRADFYEELDLYKENIDELILETEVASTLSIELFNEPDLPFDIERYKNIVNGSKAVLKSFREHDTVNLDYKIKHYGEIMEACQKPGISVEKREESLEQWGYIDYFGFHSNSKKLYPPNQSKQSYIGWVKRFRNPTDSDLKYPDYGTRNIFDYGRKLKDKEIHAHIHKVEYLSMRLNNLSIGLVHEYNDFISVANKPILKIMEVVIPFLPIRIDVDEEDLIFNYENIYSLDGAKTNNIVLLLDVSGSMSKNGKLKRLQSSISHLIKLLRKDDYLTVITYSGVPEVIFETKGKQNKKKLLSTIKHLRTKGRTNFEEGLQKAYFYCEKNWIQEGNNKVIVATDGDFKLKRNEKQIIKLKSEKGITVSTFHYLTSKNTEKGSKTLIKIAKKGKGTYTPILEENDGLKAIVNEAKKTRD